MNRFLFHIAKGAGPLIALIVLGIILFCKYLYENWEHNSNNSTSKDMFIIIGIAAIITVGLTIFCIATQ